MRSSRDNAERHYKNMDGLEKGHGNEGVEKAHERRVGKNHGSKA